MPEPTVTLPEHNPDGDSVEFSQSEIARFADDAPRQIKTMAEKFKAVGQYSDPTSMNFYLCLVFVSPEQKNAFLKALGGEANLDFFDGVEAARVLNIQLPPALLKEKKRNAEFDSLAMTP